jgi:hypothetical protein
MRDRIDPARRRAELFRQLAVIERERAAADEATGRAPKAGAAAAEFVTTDRLFADSLSFADVVVTLNGLKIFTGQAGDPVSDADFGPLASPGSLVRGLGRGAVFGQAPELFRSCIGQEMPHATFRAHALD